MLIICFLDSTYVSADPLNLLNKKIILKIATNIKEIIKE